MNYKDVGERQVKAPARALMVGRDDNVALLLSNVRIGEIILINGQHPQTALEDIPAGYKVAVYPLDTGTPVITGNLTVGTTLRPIQPGEAVHTHNLQEP